MQKKWTDEGRGFSCKRTSILEQFLQERRGHIKVFYHRLLSLKIEK